MIKNTLKIVFLGIIGFGLLVYLTAPKKNNIEKKVSNYELNINNLPRIFEVVGVNPYAKFDTVFKSGIEKYLIVLNHDSLALFKDLYKFTDKNIVMIANVSNTPWLIKKIAVNSELENMFKESKIPLINDENGNFVRSLNINDNTQNSYFIYKINIDGSIEFIEKNSVKLGALEKGISDKEIENFMETFSKKL